MNRLETILSHTLPMTFTFAQVFLAALCFYFLVHSFTCLAEIIHLKRTIDEVPEPLRKKITLAQHVKAAHYDIARTKLNWLEVTVTTALIVYLTAGNGINTISDWLMNTVGDQFAFHWMLPASVGLIFVLIDLPFCWYKEFRLREAFGYTKEIPTSWFKNYFLNTLLGWLTVLPILWIGLFLWQSSGQLWWILGWIIFAVYLVFALNLARRLLYLFKPARASLADNLQLKAVVDALGQKAGLSVGEIRITRPGDREELPPAFAFGHRQNVKLFFRHDIYERMSLDDLQAIAAHALARNLSHMYFQAWFMCAAAGFLVFAFLAWFAPQSWFLDEIGFRVYGPGPYYGSVLTFAIVALPVLLFPFRLPMDAFLRHLIFSSDTFAMRFTGLKTTVNSLIALFPTPMRHSSVTLGFFDLLFSHEPSLMARITHVERKFILLNEAKEEETLRNDSLTVLHQLENVSAALIDKQEQKVLQAQAREKKRHQLNIEFEKALIRRAQNDHSAAPGLPLKPYQDPHYEEALADLRSDNTAHPMYGKSLSEGFLTICKTLRQKFKSKSKAEAQSDLANPALASEPQSESKEAALPQAQIETVAEAIKEETSVSANLPSAEELPLQKETDAADVCEEVAALSDRDQQPQDPVFDVIDIKENNPVSEDSRSSSQDEVNQTVSAEPSTEVAEIEPTKAQAALPENETSETLKSEPADETLLKSAAQRFGKASRRMRALKTMAHRQRELYAKTHHDAQ